jgi:hypothetical protein
MTGTFSQYVSTKFDFMDMYFGRVHDGDMNEGTHAGAKLDAAIAANLEELGHGG